MEIRAKCKYDYDSIKAFVHLAMFKKSNPKKRMVFWTAAYGLLSVMIALEMVLLGVYSTLLVLIGVNIIFLMLLYFWYFFLPKKQYKSMSKIKNIENEYIFRNDGLNIISRGEGFFGESAIEYSSFKKVYETTDYLFLYQPNHQGFIVDKSTITDGTIEDIRNQLNTHVKDKYIRCKY